MSMQTITIYNSTGSNITVDTPSPPPADNNSVFTSWNGVCTNSNNTIDNPCVATSTSCIVVPGSNSTGVVSRIGTKGFKLSLAGYSASGELYEFDFQYCYAKECILMEIPLGWTLNSSNPQGDYTIQYEPDSINNTIAIYISQSPASVTFNNQTNVAINIDYPPVPALSSWTGSSTSTNYSINPGKTATGSSFSGTTFQLTAYQPTALYHFNVTLSGNGAYTIPSGAADQSNYLCNITSPSSNNYIVTISKQPTIRFVNGTGYPININYPESGLANWTGVIQSNAQAPGTSNYVIPVGCTASGTNDPSLGSGKDFISLANASPTGTQLAAYDANGALFTYNTFFGFEVPPNTKSTPTSGYNFISSYDEVSNTYVVTITQAKNLWDTSSTILKFNGNQTILHGFALTGMEYLLRGIGMDSFDLPAWGVPPLIDITPLNIPELSKITSFLPKIKGVMPTVRISLNAAYYLGVVTAGWQANYAKYKETDLSAQYQTLLDNLIAYFNSKGVVTILDLHWNYDLLPSSKISPQRPMALKSSTITPVGDSVQFWNKISLKYGNNPLVWYELFNEPFLQTSEYTLWRDGGTSSDGTEVYYGMKTLYNTVRANTSNPIVIGGSSNYAYDLNSLLQFQADVSPVGVVYNFHPYMGGSQGAEYEPTTFQGYIETIQSKVRAPVILTETGQYCCPPNGNCGSYVSTNNVGYLESILQIAQTYNLSWTVWAWRPNVTNPPNPITPLNPTSTSGAGCSGPDVNNGQALATPFASNLPACYSTATTPPCCNSATCGADFSTLIPKYYSVGVQTERS